MALSNFIILAAVIYAILYFFDVIFKTCSHYPYLAFLNWTGVDVGFFRVTWFTACLNRTFQRWGANSPSFVQSWFSVGAVLTVLLLPISFYLLIHSIVTSIFESGQSFANDGAVLVPMVPGLNLPVGDVGYYLFTLGAASVFHELGHIIAARREGVPICGVGLSLVFLLPAAFVRLDATRLTSLPPKRQLRIFCAGVWHNIVLSAAAYCILLALPLLLRPIYDTGRGVSVTHITSMSPLAGPSGVLHGDTLTAVNDCEVADNHGWLNCIGRAARNQPLGFCVSEDLVHQLDESVPVRHVAGKTVECCSATADSHLCFEALWDDAPLQILQHSCLPGRAVVGSATFSCRKPRDCPAGLHCVRPILSNGSTLLRIQRNQGPVVIFVGSALQAVTSVKVSDFVPTLSSIGSQFAENLVKMCKYLVLFSAGFAVVNTVPCFYSDGQSIVHAALRYLGISRPRKQRALELVCNVMGLTLLILNCVLVMWKTLDKNITSIQDRSPSFQVDGSVKV